MHLRSDPEGAALLPYASMISSMKRWRKRNFPPTPHTLEEFFRRATDPAYAKNLQYGSGSLSVKLVTDDHGHNHVLLYDADFVFREMLTVTRLFIDGTFRSAPDLQGVYQLVTLMAIKFNHVRNLDIDSQ